MLKAIRDWSAAILDAMERLIRAVEGAQGIRIESIDARCSELESRQARWEAEVEGVLMKAEQERKNARNAEERTRAMARNFDEAEEGDSELPEAYRRALSGGHANGGAESGLPPVSPPVGRGRQDKRAAALRLKWR